MKGPLPILLTLRPETVNKIIENIEAIQSDIQKIEQIIEPKVKNE